MRKIILLSLAILMVLSSSLTAFAELGSTLITEWDDIGFTVYEVPTTFTVSETGTLMLDDLTEGYNFNDTISVQRYVTLTKVGNGAIENMRVSISGGATTKFVMGTVNPDTLGAGSLSAQMNIRPKTNLPVGTYTETITITANGGISHSFDVSFTVNASPTYTIAAIDNQIATALVYGYESGTQETLTMSVVNTGTGNLTDLKVEFSGTNPEAFAYSQPLITTLNSQDPATSFTIVARDGLVAGTHTATVTISANEMENATFTVTQVVNLPHAPVNPQNLTVTAEDRSVSLSWDTVAGATYYNIYIYSQWSI